MNAPRVPVNDLLTFAGVSVVLITIAAAACLLPARARRRLIR